MNYKNFLGPRGRLSVSVVAAVAAVSFSSVAVAASKTFTFDADFELGTLSGVNHDAPNNNQLQLSAIGTTFPIMWIANAGEDTVTKFDTVNNVELARYRTWFGPNGQPGYVNHINNAYSGAAPSRTAVDINGNAYVLNRWFSGSKRPTLIKILAEGYIDRNGNGVMDTSGGATPLPLGDTNGNNIIDPGEIKDERIAYMVEVGPVNGLGRSMCIGTDGNLWVGMYNTQQYYKINAADGSQIAGPIAVPWTPYGCLIDKNGVLWSANLGSTLGRIDNTASNAGPYPVTAIQNMSNYGIAIGNNKVYTGSGNRVYDPATNTVGANGLTVSTSGIVVDGSGSIIGGNYSVQKVSPAGVVQWTAPLQAGGAYSVGIQVDSNNDVFQIGYSSNRVHKYRGTDGAPLGTFPVGNVPYTYSDAAGFAARNSTSPTGTWSVVFDGGANGSQWGTINWTDLIPQGASVLVEARAADVQADLPVQPYVTVSKGVPFSAQGKFIQVQARLNANTTSVSPVLYDLTINGVSTACDVDKDGDVDSIDIGLIRAGIGQTPVANDPRDANGDGKITINDVRACTLRCTRANCAAN